MSYKWSAIFLIIILSLGFAFNQLFNAYLQTTILLLLVNCIAALSLNLINGVTGQFSLGHAGFMALGAYTAAVVSMQLQYIPTLLAVTIATITGGLVAAAAGFLVGQPSLRLKGDYLAIVTLGFGEIIRVALLNIEYVGGPRGLSGIPSAGGFFASYSFVSIWLVISFVFMHRVLYSPLGRKLLSVREDEIAAENMGVNTTSTKVMSFMISSFFAGIAGALFAHVNQYISPSNFTFLISVNVVIMVVLGGLGSFTGSLIAATFLTILPEFLRPLQNWTGVDLRMVIYSVILILIMLIRPQGLLGDRNVKLTP